MKDYFQRALTVALFLSTAVAQASAGDLEKRCAEAEKKGIEFLATEQRAAGGFTTHEWRTETPDEKQTIETPFTASQVLYSLTFCEDQTSARPVCERAAAYLAAQRQPPGVWCYFGKAGAQRVTADVDDTSLAWAALKRYGQRVPSEPLELLRASRNKAGVFNTWIGDPATWKGIDSRSVDVVVNLNALLLFGLVGENMDYLSDYVARHAEKEAFRRGSIYYSSPLAFTCAFSRAYHDGGVSGLGKAVDKIRAITLELQQEDGGWGDDFETVAGLLTLINLGEKGPPVEKALDSLITRQKSDGGWAVAAVYSGDNGRRRYGSRAVTTALGLEALAKFLKP